jgi:peptidoglycan/LPS O-acetylase OafA/YrhL
MRSNQNNDSKIYELEAYRGIAALFIILFHAYQHSRVLVEYIYQHSWVHLFFVNLDVVVACFFTLSGFLVFSPFVTSAVYQGEKKSSRGFLIRRIIRIVPVYYLAILIVWSLRYVGQSEQRIDLLQHLTFTHIFSAKHIFWTIGPAWSLANEFWFYVLIAVLSPMLYKLCSYTNNIFSRQLILMSSCFTLVMTSLIYKWLVAFVWHLPETNYPAYFGPLAVIDSFALGMTLAVIQQMVQRHYRLPSLLPIMLRFLGMALFVGSFIVRSQNQLVDVYFFTIGGLAFTFLLSSSVGWPEKILWKRVFSNRFLLHLGLVSYSLYLWHEPILIAMDRLYPIYFQSVSLFPAGTILLVALSLMVATLSYWAVEYPTMFLRHLFTEDGRLANLSKPE